MSRLQHQHGFTLLEVLVAMTILAVGVSALVGAAAAGANRADFLREREFGRWVAANRLTELQVLPAWPDAGTVNTEVSMVGRTWHVRTRTQAVADPDLRRVDVEVRLNEEEDSYLYSVTAFVGNPVLRASASNTGPEIGADIGTDIGTQSQ